MQQKAMLLYARVLELAAIGGTDYTAALTTTLTTDAACPPSSADDIRAANIAIAFANATTAGASVPDTLAAKMSAIRCLQHVPGGMATLDRYLLLVTCKLGVHKAYVQ